MRIAQITDLHLDDFLSRKYGVDSTGNFSRILAEIGERDISRLVLTGDLGEESSLGKLARLLDMMGMPFYCIPGNHDELDKLAEADLIDRNLIKEGEYYYSEPMGGCRCFFLDTSRGEISDNQAAWLRREMGVSPGERVILFCHHPILDCDATLERHLALKGRETIQALLSDRKGEVHIFCGHYHSAHRSERENMIQHVTPAGIMQIRSEGNGIVTDSLDFGFRIIEIADGIRTETRMFSSGCPSSEVMV